MLTVSVPVESGASRRSSDDPSKWGKFWTRRRDPKGRWWTVRVGTPETVPWLRPMRNGRGKLGLADNRRRLIFLNSEYGIDHFIGTFRHEWGHVCMWAHGVAGHERANGRAHRAIDDMAMGADWCPKRKIPV